MMFMKIARPFKNQSNGTMSSESRKDMNFGTAGKEPNMSRHSFFQPQKTRRWLLALLTSMLLLATWGGSVWAAPTTHGHGGNQGRLICAQTHTVQRGENLYRISLRYNVSMSTLQQWNRIQNPNRILAGQRLCVAVKQSGPETPPAPPTANPTDVELVQALQNVRIRRGPGTNFAIVGHLQTGMRARVTGISQDGRWWQVLCPAGAGSSCWVSALGNLTRPISPDAPGWGESAAIIESISIQVRESYPVQVVAVVRGYLPDGCTYIDRFRQHRQGNQIRIQIATGRSDGFCTQALVPFEQTIELDVPHTASGLYSVFAGNVRSDFYLP